MVFAVVFNIFGTNHTKFVNKSFKSIANALRSLNYGFEMSMP